MGGVLGPVTAGASMLAVLLTLRVQMRQLELAQDQASDQKRDTERA